MRNPFRRTTPRVTLGHFGPWYFRRPFQLSGAGLAIHRHVQGLTGQGKSKLLADLYVQHVLQGIPAALIDPHADLANDALAALHDHGYVTDPQTAHKLLYIDFSREDYALPFNVLAQPYEAHSVARHMVEACKRAWAALGEGAAPQFENIMLASVFVLVENHLPVTALPHLLTDKPYRDGLLRHVSDPQVVHFFHERYDRWGREAPTMIESTLRRVFLLTFSPTLRYSLGQRENAVNFRSLMDTGTSVIFNLGGLDEETQRFLGCLLTVGFEVAALSRADVPEDERRHFALFLDEFSQFSATSEEALSRVLSLARKYGLFLTMANQTFSQLSERLRGALQNTASIFFRLGRADAEWAAKQLGTFDPYSVKHAVEDEHAGERTHPMYFSVQETYEQLTQELEHLHPQEAIVTVGDRVERIRTRLFPRSRASRAEIAAIKEEHARRLMRPRERVAAEIDQPHGEQPDVPVSRRAPVRHHHWYGPRERTRENKQGAA